MKSFDYFSYSHISEVVEDRSGHCRSEECLGAGSIPCLMCRYFVTTSEHRKDFERFLEITNREIEGASSEHDREMLVKKKALFIQNIAAINAFEQTEENAG